MTRVYQNQDERLGDNVLFTLAEMRDCYRANGWDNGMSDDEIDADVLTHNVEFVADHPDGCSCGSPDCPQWQAAQERI